MPASKTLKHKTKNTHRFLTFSERISQVSIDAVHQIARINVEDAGIETESKFHECLQKWKEQDKSLHFRSFYGEIVQKSKSYNMVVHYRKDIIESLMKHLAVPSSLALQSLCELLVSLCIDLRSEVYPFFPAFFKTLTELLNTKEVERLEWIFNSVSMLFKYLWRYMTKDMGNIIALYSHLICGEHPSHIAAFAAESISFLLRKVKGGQEIYKQLFELNDDNESACEGVARVIFHVIKGTKGSFHSSAQSVLRTVFAITCDADTDSAAQCFSSIVNLIAEHSNKTLPNPMWSFLFERLDCVIKEKNSKEMSVLLTMFQTWCGYKGGVLILEPDKLIGILEKCFNIKANAIPCELLDLCETVILSEKTNIGPLLVNKLLGKVVDTTDVPWDATSGFWKRISFYVQKNSITTQSFLKFCHKRLQINEMPKNVVVLLAHYIAANVKVPDDANDIRAYCPPKLDFALLSRNKTDKKIGNLLVEIFQNDVLDYNLVWCALLVIQHVKPIPKDTLITIRSLYERLVESLHENCINSKLILAVMRMNLQTVVVLAKGAEEGNPLQTIKDKSQTANIFMRHSQDQNALLIICLLMQYDPTVVEEVKREHLHQAIICNLSSSDPVTRKYSLEILGAVHPDIDMIKYCLRTEVSPATVQDYRTKVLHLSKVKRTESLSSDIAEGLLRYLVANLYINFSSYWPLVQDAITSFMQENKNDSLWKLLLDLLDDASSDAISSTASRYQTGGPCNSSTDGAHCLVQENGLKFNLNTEVNPKIDYFNHRMLLWNTLNKIPYKGVLESHNKRLIMLFFKYLEEEHYKVDKMHAPSQNLCPKNSSIPIEESARKKREMNKTLIAHLEVFSGFSSPASCYQYERLKTIYEQLLMHEDAGVQLQALKCYLKFRNKNLDSHKEILMSLLDETKIKEAMIHFDLSEIEPGERKSLIPVLLRLLYGRMTSKSGLGFHGKGHSESRKSIVLRFLSSLSADEMQSFVLLALGPLRNCLNEEELHMPLTSVPPVIPGQVIPLSRQRGIIGTVMQIVGKHSNQLSKYMFDYLLKLLLLLLSSYDHLLSLVGETPAIESECLDSENVQILQCCEIAVVDKRFSPFLRHLSKDVQAVIGALIKTWPAGHTLAAMQIESIFNIMVNPHLHKLKNECISQPTSLMQFFDKLARQSRFIPILAHTTDKNVIPMGEIISVLLSEKSSVAVCTYIMNMIQTMLDENKEENEKDEMVLQTLNNVSTEVFRTDNISCAEIAKRLISVYAKEIMNYFIRKMKTSGKSYSVMQSQLKVLDAVSEYVTDRDMSLQLIELLLNHISGIVKPVNKGSSVSEKSITTVLQTLTSISGDSRFIPLISRLFSCIKSREGRLLLVEVLQRSCQDASKELKDVASVVSDLNSWDKRFVEKIDFDTRLDAFQQVNKSLSGPDAVSFLENDCISLLPILHCAVFTLFHHNDDMSLRVSSTRVLELIINLVMGNKATEKYTSAYHTVMSSVILPRIQNMNASEHEVLRNEGIQLLVTVVKLSNSEMNLSELAILCNESDPDADFFDNVRHIQFHRRTRAFRKLAQVIISKRKEGDSSNSTDTVISHSNVINYLLPLAVQTLKYQDLSKHQHLKDACLEAVSSAASIMPWSAYQKFLLQNLAGISKYSLGVRIVCAVLEAFHFDVSSNSAQHCPKTISIPSVDEDGMTGDGSVGEKTKLNNTNKEPKDIYDVIVLNILPKLYSTLSGKLESDSEHKLANATHYTDIDQCTARAPLAVAIVSTLKKLPEDLLKSQLPQVLLKIILFLRHRYFEIRSVASKTITEMTGLLGPFYVKVVLQELKSGLARGYQRHVLMHTVNCVLNSLCSSLKVGDLDSCVGVLKDLLVDDLFGKNEAERGVDKITVKLPEARGRSKAYNVFKILAKFAKKETLLALISPLKNVLDSTHDHAKRKIVDTVLMEINHGLLENTGLTAEDTLIFLHGLLTENLPGIFTSNESLKKAWKGQKQGLQPKSCYLLPKEPGRYGTRKAKKTFKTNLHLIIEFALLLLNNSLKRQVISLNEKEHLRMLDPLVTVLLHCLKSAHRKSVIESTRCLTKLFRSSLPAVEEQGSEIIKTLFCILREHSRGSGNSEVAGAAFKALSVICSTKLGEKLADTQLQVLLGYAEEDLCEMNRKTYAFNVIRSILALGLKCDEILDVVDKVRAICIQTHDTSAMNQARQVYLYFILHYPLSESKFSGHLEFVLAQLTFEHESGRLSALELLGSLISAFPLPILTSNAGMIFVPLATVLVNDECVKCRKSSSHVIKQLLAKIPVEIRDQLFGFVLHWYVLFYIALDKL